MNPQFIFKIIIFILMIAILVALGSGLYNLLFSDKSEDTAKSLTWRISLSIFLFILLFFAFAMGWIRPHALIPGNAVQNQSTK